MPDQLHVLVAEDEPLAAMAIEDLLSCKGYRVTVAGDGLEAIERYRTDPADVIITDLRMPRMDGYRLIRELRSLCPTLPIIIMTGHFATDMGELADATTKPNEILSKPVSPQTILDALRRTFDPAA